MVTTDKVVRILLVVVIAGLLFTNLISGTIVTELLVLADVFILTGLMSFCPLCFPFGISAQKKVK